MKTGKNKLDLIPCDYCDAIISIHDRQSGRAKYFAEIRGIEGDEAGWICETCADKEEEFYLNGNKN